jgi:hypothetical protein
MAKDKKPKAAKISSITIKAEDRLLLIEAKVEKLLKVLKSQGYWPDEYGAPAGVRILGGQSGVWPVAGWWDEGCARGGLPQSWVDDSQYCHGVGMAQQTISDEVVERVAQAVEREQGWIGLSGDTLYMDWLREVVRRLETERSHPND